MNTFRELLESGKIYTNEKKLVGGIFILKMPKIKMMY